MTIPRSSALRPVLAGLLVAVLVLAGVGRGFAAGSDAEPGFGIPGVAFHICHAGAGDGSVPADGGRHDCCDACALCAAVTLADTPPLNEPVSVAHVVAHARALAWVPVLVRPRTPRQSQGPPTA